MRRLILNWLFGVDNVPDYMETLKKCIDLCDECMDERKAHIESIEERKRDLEEHKRSIETIIKLIKICENHGIDVEKEINEIEEV